MRARAGDPMERSALSFPDNSASNSPIPDNERLG